MIEEKSLPRSLTFRKNTKNIDLTPNLTLSFHMRAENCPLSQE